MCLARTQTESGDKSLHICTVRSKQRRRRCIRQRAVCLKFSVRVEEGDPE
jgi:hypothetical protein